MTVATWQQAMNEWARNAGVMFPERAWLLHDNDVWLANPYYQGPPVAHPEDDAWEEENIEQLWYADSFE